MRIRAARAHEDALDLRPLLQVVGEGGSHAGVGVSGDGETVRAAGGGDEGVDFGEGVPREDVDAGEEGGEGARVVGAEGGEEEDQQDEAVFAAVVGEGDFGEAGEWGGGGWSVCVRGFGGMGWGGGMECGWVEGMGGGHTCIWSRHL